MDESANAAGATPLRERRRRETERRICRSAQRLTGAHGLDGFTMEDLAAEAGVSRRTLFNYFPGKVDAVLGAAPELPDADLAVFVAGGPHGLLLDDALVLARVILGEEEIGREEAALHQRLFTTTPRLIAAAHGRFEEMLADFGALILEREGPAYGAARARLLLRLILSVFDDALLAFLDDPGERALVEHFDQTMRTARDLLA